MAGTDVENQHFVETKQIFSSSDDILNMVKLTSNCPNSLQFQTMPLYLCQLKGKSWH